VKAKIQDKSQHHVIFASTILLLLFVGLTLFVVSIVRADPRPSGSGSAVDESMNVPDLRLSAIDTAFENAAAGLKRLAP
jgi:hypothetical protein